MEGIAGERAPAVVAALERLRGMAKAAGARKDELLADVAAVEGALHPSLFSRFEALARETKLPGWEQDIEAFRRFNQTRNYLFHRGGRDVRLILPPQQNSGAVDFKVESADFEDLVERYVCFRLMGDARVYPASTAPLSLVIQSPHRVRE